MSPDRVRERTGVKRGAGVASAAEVIRLRGELVLGRDPATSVVLNHPAVSRRHAQLHTSPRGVVVRDLDSTNGVYVNGERITGEEILASGDTLDIGPFGWVLSDTELWPKEAGRTALIEAHQLRREITAEGVVRCLLDDVSIVLQTGEFVAVLGPSGCGKSTLIRLLSARSTPTSGEVTYAGRELFAHFDLLKHTIAFVPQRETLPEDLTVREALRYTGKLRLPADASAEDIRVAVDEALERVGLRAQGDLRIGKLSGGQRKRAALANELLARPQVLFLDEVTSGLDEATDREMMALFRQLADQGITIVCVTHTVANVGANCDQVLVMAKGGHVAYHGPPEAALAFFDTDSLSDIYERLDGTAPTEWAKRFRELAGPVVRRGSAPATRAGAHGRETKRDRRVPFAQLPVLALRNVAVTLADARTLAFAIAQSLCVGALFRLVFGGGRLEGPAELQFAFLLGVSSFWFGCSNASKEIVKERLLFRLERDINLRIPSYVLAKMIVLALIGGVQVILLHGVIAVSGVQVANIRELLGLHLLVVSVGSALGLAISAYAQRDEQAATLVPIALIPQILLAGAVVPTLPPAAERLAQAAVSAYWMYEAQSGLFGVTTADAGKALLVLGAHLVAYLGLAMLTLHLSSRRDQ